MKRSKLALLCALLLMSASGRSALPSVDAGPSLHAGSARAREVVAVPEFGRETILSILRVLNPRLRDQERQRIAQAVLDSSEKYGIDPALLMAVMWEESDVRPWAHSPKGAIGLMQVMPHMSAPSSMAGNLTTIENNVELGCVILADNIRRLGVEDGISSYFWGSEIRGVSYLHRVLEKHASVQRLAES
ncbi:MAG: transglycosylase SLT domain-containing protein [Deltaproteobacteria bacterium]|nr:transglycosylase SLT domain-containing protein [Deltaproteobacteria bacterium]MBW2399795.1 transglycosylase SLT domain-containing protein [Deltaproteobacteria bacterium]